jgi:3-deoxy-manno-octulosonate cytidylyltransferase (CMP-KDO synthetase)
MRVAVVIPARYQSSRLPGKPLVDLCGVPMIVRTYRQCALAMPPEAIYVATDDERIEQVCRRHAIQCLMTPPHCLTGTDRVAAAAAVVDADIYVNVQGDEPLFNPADLARLVAAAREHPREVLNGYCEIADETLFRSGNIPKVVLRPDGRLLYMSRAPIPTDKTLGFIRAWRQVCAYALPRDALLAFSARPGKTPLEEIEDIEILRFLELGWEVRMVPMSAESVAVDNPEDVARVVALLQAPRSQ